MSIIPQYGAKIKKEKREKNLSYKEYLEWPVFLTALTDTPAQVRSFYQLKFHPGCAHCSLRWQIFKSELLHG